MFSLICILAFAVFMTWLTAPLHKNHPFIG